MNKTTSLVPPTKWHGGKNYLAERIVALMPPRCQKPNAPASGDTGYLHYVEPFAGGLAVLLANNPEGISEVANDLNVDLTNFWCVLQNKPLFDAFHRATQSTPFSELEFDDASEILRGDTPDITYEIATGISDPRAATSVARAYAFFIRCRQSLAGRMDSFAPISRNRTRRGMNEQVSAWLNAVEGLPAVHERLKRVLILNRPALDVIRQQDGPRTLTYMDPPYSHSTRTSTGEYTHEMTDADHRELLIAITDPAMKSRFMLSGYDNALYQEYLGQWNRHTFDLPNHAAGGDTKRRMTEVLWCNY